MLLNFVKGIHDPKGPKPVWCDLYKMTFKIRTTTIEGMRKLCWFIMAPSMTTLVEQSKGEYIRLEHNYLNNVKLQAVYCLDY
jgi:hypothetical protein